MYEIVSNAENSIDVDKFDYISRDSYNIGFKIVHFDYDRLISKCKVINGDICFHKANDYNIYGLFQSRYQLFKEVYMEKTLMGVENMVSDALIEAGTCYNYLESINNPVEYVKLTDCMLELIEYSKKPVSSSFNRRQELAKASDILKRIKRRDLYKFAGEALIKPEILSKMKPVD